VLANDGSINLSIMYYSGHAGVVIKRQAASYNSFE
jgi:hypothetical protein